MIPNDANVTGAAASTGCSSSSSSDWIFSSGNSFEVEAAETIRDEDAMDSAPDSDPDSEPDADADSLIWSFCVETEELFAKIKECWSICLD